MKAKKGISLIVLVITIIVIIILAGAVILSLSGNNPINSANKATLLSDRANVQSEVTSAVAAQFAATTGVYDVNNFDVTSSTTITADNAYMQSVKDYLTKMESKYTGSTWTVVDGDVKVEMPSSASYITTDDTTAYSWLTIGA